MDTHRVNKTVADQNTATVFSYSKLVVAAALAVAATTIILLSTSPMAAADDGDDTRPNMLYVCSDFTSQDEAQWWFDLWHDEYPELLRLDGDENGIACQSLPTLQDLHRVAEKANLLERRRR